MLLREVIVTDTSSTKTLTKLLERKHKVLTELSRLVEQQSQSIQAHRSSELLPLLSAKQHLLDDLKEIERELDPYRHEDPNTRSWNSDEERERAAQLSTENRTLLKAILDQENDCESALAKQRESVKQKLDDQAGGAQAMEAYDQLEPQRRNRLDLTSDD